jgi:hypothetical protein
LMYRCFFQSDRDALCAADEAFLAARSQQSSQSSEMRVGVFEHC